MAERGGVRGVRGVRGAGDPGTIWEAQVVMLHTVPETVAERRRIDGLRGAMGSKICFGLGGGKMEGPDVELARLCVELGNGWGMSEKGEGHLAAHDRQEQLGPKMEEQEGKNKTHGVWSDCDWVGRVSRLDDRDAKEKMRSSSCSCERVRLAGESTASEPPGIRGLENKRERWPSFVQ